jgi:hypothetical protein
MARLLRRLLVLALFGVAVGAAVRALQARRLVAPAPDAGPSWPPLTPAVPEPPAAAGEAAASWVEPVAGGCPDGYPVKANRSGIFHVPGGQFYDRTVPERCYLDPQAAEADGYRPARR